MRAVIHRVLSVVLIVFLVVNSFYTQPTFASVSASPTVQPLSVCWVKHWNGTGSTEWHITNPNPVPLSSNPDTNVRYNWRVFNTFNALGTVLQSANDWDNSNPNPVNTVYAQSITVEWYLATGSHADRISGNTVVNANTSGKCADASSDTAFNSTVAKSPIPIMSTKAVIATASPNASQDTKIVVDVHLAANGQQVQSAGRVSRAQVSAQSTPNISIVQSHVDTIGIYRPSQHTFYLQDINQGPYGYTGISFGTGNVYPIVGDWNGDGVDTVGVYDQDQAIFSLRDSNYSGSSDYTVAFGSAGDQPLSGRWSGQATHDGIGIFRSSNGVINLRNNVSAGPVDYAMVLGYPGDVGVAGDWTGQGYDSVGVYRPSTATFYLSDQVCNCIPSAAHTAVLGSANMKPLAGDWTGLGHDGIGIYDSSPKVTFSLKNDPSTGSAENSFRYGVEGDIPVAGRWGNVYGVFYRGTPSDTAFTANVGSTAFFKEGFPNIAFNPDSGQYPPNSLGSGMPTSNTTPFTDVSVDANGNYAGLMLAQEGSNASSAGTGVLSAFNAVFTGYLSVTDQGVGSLRFYHDDGFILGIGHSQKTGLIPQPSQGPNFNSPGNTPFLNLSVMSSDNEHKAGPSFDTVQVYFPAAGVYPFELDYFQITNALTLNLTTSFISATPTPTATNTYTPSSTYTPTATTTFTPSNTFTPSPTATATVTPLYTASQTLTSSVTATFTLTPMPTFSKTNTAVFKCQNTPTPSGNPTVVPTPCNTLTPSPTLTPSFTKTSTITLTPSLTKAPTITLTPSLTKAPTVTLTPSITKTPSPTLTPSITKTSSTTPTFTPAAATSTATNTPTPDPLGGATLSLSPSIAGPLVLGTGQALTLVLNNAVGNPLGGISVTFKTLTGSANTIATTLVTDVNGTAVLTYTGALSGLDTVQASVMTGNGIINSNTASLTWLVPAHKISTDTVWGRFFKNDANVCSFGVTPQTKPLFDQTFPTINFNPFWFGVIPGNQNVWQNTHPFTDVTTDLNGNYTGTIVAQGNGYTADGPFFAVLTSAFVVKQAGPISFQVYSDDGFILGVGNNATIDPTSSPLQDPNHTLKTPFNNLNVMGAFNQPSSSGPNGYAVVVDFPAPGIYPYEVDYTECAGYSLTMTLGVDGIGTVPSTSLTLTRQNLIGTGLPVGAQSPIFTVKAQDASGAVLPNIPITLAISGVNPQNQVAITDSTGVATFQSYTGYNGGAPSYGVDTVQAFANVSGQAAYSAQLQVLWYVNTPYACSTLPNPQELVVPGWLDDTGLKTGVTGSVPIKLANMPFWAQNQPNMSLTSGTVDYWPVDAPPSSGFGTILTSTASGPNGTTVANLDTTLLPNGSYVVRLCGTSNTQTQVNSGILIKVVGDYKPGRVRFSVTDLTVPIVGLPISIGRTYDSLNRSQVGDFGNGWSLDLGSPKIQVNQAHDVTLTQPNGQRVTYYFAPQPGGGFFGFLQQPAYQPEPGVYGSLVSIGCNLLAPAGGQYFCFPGGAFEPSGYKYTDPYGRVFVYSISIDAVTHKQTSQLVSVTDLNHNMLTFSQNGITSSTGLSVPFLRDTQGRITQITDPMSRIYTYGYDPITGDLATVTLPDVTQPVAYHYFTSTDCSVCAHLFKDAVDPRGNRAVSTLYTADGRLQQETDAVGNVTSYVYDVPGHTTTQTNPDLGTVVTSYNDYGDMLSMTDPLNRTTTNHYDANHKLMDTTNAASETTSYTYDANGHTTSVTNGLSIKVLSVNYNQYGRPITLTNAVNTQWTVGYNVNFMPQSITDTLGMVGGYSWDLHGSPLNETDGNGKITTNIYDAYGNRLSQSAPLGRQTSYTYDLMGRPLTFTDARQNTTTFTYDARGNILTAIDARKGLTSFEYDPNKNKTAMVDPLLHRTTYEYDRANRLTKVNYSDGTFVTYDSYDFRGNKLHQTDPTGNVTTYLYDKAGQLLTITRASGTVDSSITTYDYDLAGRQWHVTDANSHITTYTYDKAGQLKSTNDPMNRITSNDYDNAGQLIDSYDGNNYKTSYTYDIRGRLKVTTYQNNTISQQSYDGMGHVTQRIDQNNKPSNYGYNDAGQLSSFTDALNQVTSYLYDNNGNLLSIQDANTHTTLFAYDELNRQIRKQWPDGSFEMFGYDAAGNQLSHQLTDGHTNTITYDNMNRPFTMSYFDGKNTTYGYVNGLRQTVTDERGITNYVYDKLHRIKSITQPNNQAVSYTYDPLGNRLSMTSPSGTISYTYNNDRQLATVNDSLGQLANYTYDNAGMRTQLALRNGINVDYTHDTLNRLTDIVQHIGPQVPIAAYHYQLDLVGNRTGVTEQDGSTFAWTYDDVYRLLSETRSAAGVGGATATPSGTTAPTFVPTASTATAGPSATPTLTGTPNAGSNLSWTTLFTYDPVGNRKTKTENGQTVNYTYNSLDQLTISGTAGQVTYQYDLRGNLTNIYDSTNALNNVTYGWDARDRITAATTTTAQTAQFTYDDSGHRVSQSLGTPATTINYLWDPMSPYGDVIQETDGSGNPIANYILGGSELLTQTRGSSTNYYLHDAQNSIRTLTNGTGTRTDSYINDAYGNMRIHSGTTINSYQYTGQEFDSATGLYYLRARYYSPQNGRFIARDKFSPQSPNPLLINRYNYGNSQPINHSDPTGFLALETAINDVESVAGGEAVVALGEEVWDYYLIGLWEINLSTTSSAAIIGKIITFVLPLVLLAPEPSKPEEKKKSPQVDIALGFTKSLSEDNILAKFSKNLSNNQRVVIPWMEWDYHFDEVPSEAELRSIKVNVFIKIFRTVATTTTAIHVNLEKLNERYSGEYEPSSLSDFANDHGDLEEYESDKSYPIDPLAAELYIISEGYCGKTDFYTNGSTVPVKISTDLC